MARLNVTYNGHNGDFPDDVEFDVTDQELRTMAAEGLQTGYIPGMGEHPGATLADFKVDRFPAADDLPDRLFIRPKTAVGRMNVQQELKEVLELRGCKVAERAGIWNVYTPSGVWDMTVPQPVQGRGSVGC